MSLIFYITMTKVSDRNNQLEMKSSKHEPVRDILNQNHNIYHYIQLPVGEKCVKILPGNDIILS